MADGIACPKSSKYYCLRQTLPAAAVSLVGLSTGERAASRRNRGKKTGASWRFQRLDDRFGCRMFSDRAGASGSPIGGFLA